MMTFLLIIILSCLNDSKAFLVVGRSSLWTGKAAYFQQDRRSQPFVAATTDAFASKNTVDVPTKDEEEEEEKLFPERLNIIYDSKCSVCRWEVEFLDSIQKSSQQKSSSYTSTTTTILPLRFTDLEEEGYNPNLPSNGGITYAQGMKSFHAVKSDGTILHGVPVFREAYNIVGLGWLWSWTVDIPWLGKLADALYNIFVMYRTDITRGSSVRELIRSYEEKRVKEGGDGGKGGEEASSCQKCEEKIAASLMVE